MAVFLGLLPYTTAIQTELAMPKEEQMHIRVSAAKKERIQKRAESLDRSISTHILLCYDLEESIAKGDSIVIPKSKQVDSESKSASQ